MAEMFADRDAARKQLFEATAIPHLDAVFSRAHFLLRNSADAEDATQECYARALRYFDTYRGSGIRAWLFTILKNLCFSEFARHDRHALVGDQLGTLEAAPEALWQDAVETPEELAQRRQEGGAIRTSIAALPSSLREVLILRELDALSYKEIAELIEVPIGTVMSRLARARALLREVVDTSATASNVIYADDIDQWSRPEIPRLTN